MNMTLPVIRCVVCGCDCRTVYNVSAHEYRIQHGEDSEAIYLLPLIKTEIQNLVDIGMGLYDWMAKIHENNK